MKARQQRYRLPLLISILSLLPVAILGWTGGGAIQATVNGNQVTVSGTVTTGDHYQLEYCDTYGTSIAFRYNDSVSLGSWSSSSGPSGSFSPTMVQTPIDQYCPDGLMFQNGQYQYQFTFYDYTPGTHTVTVPVEWSGDGSGTSYATATYTIP